MENCELESEEPLSVCRNYQGTLLGGAYFLHPIHEFFGSRLLETYGEGPWLKDLHRAAITSQLVGGLLAVGLWLLFVVSLPYAVRNFVVALSLLLLLLDYYGDDSTLVLPDPFADSIQVWEVPALVLIAGALLFGHRWGKRFFLHGRLDLARRITVHRKRVLQAFLCVFLVNLILPPIGAAVAQLVAMAAVFVAVWWVVSSEDLSPLIVGSILFLLFIMISGDHHFLLRKLEISKHQLFLVFSVYLTYVAVKPRGILVYSLPAFAVFHVPATALLGLVLFLAELPLCLRRLRISPILVVSAVTFAVWYWVMQKSLIFLTDQPNSAIRHVTFLVLEDPRLWSMSLVLIMMASVSLWPLLLRDERWDHVVRCGFLALQGMGTSFVTIVILDAEPGLRLTPGYFMFVTLRGYLGPPLAYGVILSLSLVLFRMCASDEPVVANGPPLLSVDWKRIGSIAVIVLLLGLAKIDLKPRFLFLDALYNTVVHIGLAHVHKDWCRYLAQGAGFDDQYILSDRKPTNSAENAFSALKLKLRIALDEHDPEQMQVSIARREDRCWW